MKRRDLLADMQIPADDEAMFPVLSAPARSQRTNRAVVEIPIAAIIEASALQTRQVTFDPEQFPEDAELLESVRSYGVIEPILAQALAAPPGEPVRYRLVFGNRRTQAARMAGRETVPAILAHSREAMDVLTIAENSGRRELTAYEKARVLIQLKKQTPGISGPELAKITGWPQPTIYALLAAYEKSPPVLRRLFAEGRASTRTIQEMQPLFASVPETEHEALETLLADRSYAEIVQLHHAVNLGQDPLETARLLSNADRRTAEPAITTESDSRPSYKEPVNTVQSHPAPVRSTQSQAASEPKSRTPNDALVAGDDAMVRSLVEMTGIGRAAAERLLELAAAASLPYNTLCIACLYVARGGEENQALELARLAFRHRKAGGALRRQIDHLHALSANRAWAAGVPGRELQSFFQILFRA